MKRLISITIWGLDFSLGAGGNNLILNRDSHSNYDPKSKAGDGENADGFGCHPKAGDVGNVFRGVRAWWNTDDGYVAINALEACLVENSWAWLNGYLPGTTQEPNRDPTLPPGNGIRVPITFTIVGLAYSGLAPDLGAYEYAPPVGIWFGRSPVARFKTGVEILPGIRTFDLNGRESPRRPLSH